MKLFTQYLKSIWGGGGGASILCHRALASFINAIAIRYSAILLLYGASCYIALSVVINARVFRDSAIVLS